MMLLLICFFVCNGVGGTIPLPPKWALGYHQCRWSYEPAARVVEVSLSSFGSNMIFVAYVKVAGGFWQLLSVPSTASLLGTLYGAVYPPGPLGKVQVGGGCGFIFSLVEFAVNKRCFLKGFAFLLFQVQSASCVAAGRTPAGRFNQLKIKGICTIDVHEILLAVSICISSRLDHSSVRTELT